MRINLQFRGESGVLLVVATGKFALEQAKRTFSQMLQTSAAEKCKKVLFDGRRITGNPRAIERFYYGEFAAQEVISSLQRGVSVAEQFAYVLTEPVLDPRRFGETVAVNRGLNIKAFDNLEEAVQWLGVAPSDQADVITAKPASDSR